MRRLIKMPNGKEGTILVEVDVPDEEIEDEKRKVGFFDKRKPEIVDEDFANLSQMLVKCSKPITDALEMLKEEKFQPQKATAEFGFKFTAQGNIYLVQATGEASVTVSFEWDIGSKP